MALSRERRPAAVEVDRQDAQVAALLRERDGYVRAGRPDRADQVSAELARLGVAAPVKVPARERAVSKAPERAVEV